MISAAPRVLTINGGSSSLWFAVYKTGGKLRLAGKIDRIGLRGTHLTWSGLEGKAPGPRRVAIIDHGNAAKFLFDWLEAQPVFASVKAVGHRVGHGMKHAEPERVTPKLLAELHRITPYDPDPPPPFHQGSRALWLSGALLRLLDGGELARLDPAAVKGCVILAHLGNGASLPAVHHGKSIDTSMASHLRRDG